MSTTKKPIDVQSLNWREVVMRAQMQRVQYPLEDAETITVERGTYDALVAIAQLAADLQGYGNPNGELEILQASDGFQVTFRDNLIGEFTMTKPKLLEALRETQFRRGLKIERLIE